MNRTHAAHTPRCGRRLVLGMLLGCGLLLGGCSDDPALGNWLLDRSGDRDETAELNGSDSYTIPAEQSTVVTDTWIHAPRDSIEDITWSQVGGAGELSFSPPDNIRTRIRLPVAGSFVARLLVHYRMASGAERDVVKTITVTRAAAD